MMMKFICNKKIICCYSFIVVLIISYSAYAQKRIKKCSALTLPRHYRKVNSSFYNSSIMSYAGYMSCDKMQASSKKSAEKRAAELADLGVNCVLLNGAHSRLAYKNDWGDIKKQSKNIVEACHKYKIKCIEHFNLSVFMYKNYPMMLKHLDWLQKDYRTGEPVRWCCPNNPDFIKYFADYLVDFQKATDVDGYMLDELGLMNQYSCGCRHCRKKFYKRTGLKIPDHLDAKESPELYKAWMLYRGGVKSGAEAELMKAVRKIRPDIMDLSYCSDYSDSTIVNRGIDLSRDVALYCSFMGWEAMIAEMVNGWRAYMRALKLRLSYANYYDIPVWVYTREPRNKEASYFAWIMCQLGKHSVWHSSHAVKSRQDAEYFKQYNTWKDFMPHRFARCLTRTGILLSHQTRFTNPQRSFYWSELAGWTDAMLEGNNQFDTLLDGDFELPGRLKKYKVLILPMTASMSKRQCQNLTTWVRNGGTAVLTCHAATRDQYGNIKGQFHIAKQMGISWKGSSRGQLRVEGKLGGIPVSFKTGRSYTKIKINDNKRVKVLLYGSLVDGKGTVPVIFESGLGKGRFIYIADAMGFRTYEMWLRGGHTLRPPQDKATAKAIQTIVDYAGKGKQPVKLHFPDGVKGFAYQLHGGKNKGMIYVQIMNVKGKNASFGYVAPPGINEKINLPEIKQKIRIVLKNQPSGSIEITGPFMTETHKVKPQKMANGKYEIVIPGKLLKAYMQVKIPSKDIVSQTPCPVPLAKGI